MKIIYCHNRYRFPGGEDQVFEDETTMLESHGHQVIRFEKYNSDIDSMSKVKVALGSIWNRKSNQQLIELATRVQPDVVHFANTFPLISPSSFWAIKKCSKAAVIQTLHNFRLICPGSLLFRDDLPCESCVGKTFATKAIYKGCFRKSSSETVFPVLRNAFHKLAKTYETKVDRLIALTHFSKSKFVAGGYHPDSIIVKPNFVSKDPGHRITPNGPLVFAGRLTKEKGINVLLDAWGKTKKDRELRIIGDGDLRDLVVSHSEKNLGVSYLGQLPHEAVLEEMKQASAVIVPSIWYETFGRTLIESFAVGTPVIASDLGAMAEIVTHKKNGLLFKPSNSNALAECIERLFRQQNSNFYVCLAINARNEYELKYSEKANYPLLINVYEEAIRNARERSI